MQPFANSRDSHHKDQFTRSPQTVFRGLRARKTRLPSCPVSTTKRIPPLSKSKSWKVHLQYPAPSRISYRPGCEILSLNITGFLKLSKRKQELFVSFRILLYKDVVVCMRRRGRDQMFEKARANRFQTLDFYGKTPFSSRRNGSNSPRSSKTIELRRIRQPLLQT